MKYGNFVSTEHVPCSQMELDNFKNHFCNLPIVKKMMADFNLTFSNISIERDIVSINFDCPIISKRNKFKSRIVFYGITFLIFKNKGYLDKTDWNVKNVKRIDDYDNAPDFQYSVYIVASGSEIGYRCRTCCNISLKNSYDYNTVIEEITFTDSLYDLYKKLK
mgnify:CR=1 FL=1